MDFGFTDAEEEYRAQVRSEFRDPAVRAAIADLPADNVGGPELARLYRMLGERDLLAPHWPREYGGQNRTFNEGWIAAEELLRAGVPEALQINAVQVVGQFLLLVGSHEQKLRYLPPIAGGKEFPTVLYSEPEIGSDLGALSTAAERDGSGYKITGTKIFSLKTNMATHSLCAARTSDGATKYEGITLFMIDMTSPGLRVAPIPSISNEPFYRVDLDGVWVPEENVLGEEGEGWAQLSRGLAVERTGIDYFLKGEAWFDHAMGHLAEQYPVTSDASDALLERIGRLGGSLYSSYLLSWEVLGGLGAGRVDELASAAAKYYASEVAGEVARWGSGVPTAAQRAACGGVTKVDEGYLEAPGLTLSAGTSEMMLQIVAAAIDNPGQEA
jgi:alkylation response protein AidB-like acyl-CoA dehydrogenase